MKVYKDIADNYTHPAPEAKQEPVQGMVCYLLATDTGYETCSKSTDGAFPVFTHPAPVNQQLLEALKEVWLWMENQADGQSKGGHATFDLMMLREHRDIARAAIAAAEGKV